MNTGGVHWDRDDGTVVAMADYADVNGARMW